MKKIVSLVLVCVLMLGVMFTLASCGSNISAAYAEKVNEAAKNKEPLTHEQVLKDLGDAAIDATADIPVLGVGGVVVAIKGIDASEYKDLELEEVMEKLEADAEKLEEGETLEAIVIVIAGGKATNATYSKYPDDKK